MAEVEKAIQVYKEKEDDEVEEKWVKYYSSFHEILLVGEGDFSFSTCLALSFGSASNIVASSLDSYDEVIDKYKQAKSNFAILDKLGASHLHGVDVTNMKFHSNLNMRKFDRIVFNFPHAGFHGKEDNNLLLGKHRSLLFGFFKNTSRMLRPNGEIHVNHKTSIPYCYWNLEELANKNYLKLIERVAFKKEDYPGYENKRGSGLRCDEPFPLRECCTFKFCFSPNAKVSRAKQNVKMPQILAKAPTFVPRQPNTFEFRHPPLVTFMNDTSALKLPYGRSLELFQTPIRASHQGNYLEHKEPPSNFDLPMNGIPRCMESPHIDRVYLECYRIFGMELKHVAKALERSDHYPSFFLTEALQLGYERYMAREPGRTRSGYRNILEQLRIFFGGRQEWQVSTLEYHPGSNSRIGPFM